MKVKYTLAVINDYLVNILQGIYEQVKPLSNMRRRWDLFAIWLTDQIIYNTTYIHDPFQAIPSFSN